MSLHPAATLLEKERGNHRVRTGREGIMGYNRSGTRRKERLKRHRREQQRLLKKSAEAPAKEGQPTAAKPQPQG
jgi:hypothetical protein